MAYRTYNTEGIVLKQYAVRASDGMVVMYTRRFGLISGIARGVRTMKSKLRYHLVPYSHISVSVVRGKTGWRIVGAQGISVFHDIVEVGRKGGVAGEMFDLIMRATDEGRDDSVYTILLENLHFLEKHTFSVHQLDVLSVLSKTRLLRVLGYGVEEMCTSGGALSYADIQAVNRRMLATLRNNMQRMLGGV